MRCGEVRMAGQDHDLVLTHPIGKPVGQSGATEVVEFPAVPLKNPIPAEA